MIHRRQFLGSAACVALARALQNARRPPNIIHFLADDVGYDDVGCYGATDLRTPNVGR